MDPTTRIEQALHAAVATGETPGCPPRLAAAMRHAVFPGGARIRPQLCVAVARACGDSDPALADAARAAIALLHCTSLVHDDLPCFDNAATRRGQASVHSEWFDVIGISVGSDARLDWLKSGIGAIRNASRNRSIGVLVGGPSFAADMARVREVGVDGTASNGEQAPLIAEQLLAERQRARG